METRGKTSNPTYLPNGGEPVTSNDEHREAEYTEVDYITSRSNLNDINEKTQQRRERLNDDVSERNAADETDGSKNFDSSDPPVFPKNQKRLPESSQSQGKLQTLRKVISNSEPTITTKTVSTIY